MWTVILRDSLVAQMVKNLPAMLETWIRLYWICYNIASALCFAFVGPESGISGPQPGLHLQPLPWMQSLNHWTTREALYIFFNLILYCIISEKAMAPHSSTLAWRIHGWRSLVGCSPWGCWESDTTERLHFHFSLSCTGEGNGNPLQYSCLKNPRDGEAWWAAVYGVAQSRTRLKRLSSNSSSSRDYHNEWSKREKDKYYIISHVGSKIMQMSLFTKEKQTHRHRKQTYGYHRGKWGEG